MFRMAVDERKVVPTVMPRCGLVFPVGVVTDAPTEIAAVDGAFMHIQKTENKRRRRRTNLEKFPSVRIIGVIVYGWA